MTLKISICVFLLLTSLCDNLNSVVVETKNGLLKGFLSKTIEEKVVYAFLGVPYAKAPLGELRFKDSGPVHDWKGIKEALSYGPECFQLAPPSHIVGKEDCLYLNIFTPTLNNAGLEVIFYIHGGAFMFGSGETVMPDYIMDRKDIIFISFNYRLGPLGFLSSEDHVIPGNFGLKDQVLALKWVNDNIKYFGGDKAKITIAGFSAGGASVHFHYFSNLSKDLFQCGISQSGTAFCPWALTENSREKTETLANFMQCPTDDMELVLKCLQQKPAEEIVRHSNKFMPWLNNPLTPFGPVVENNTYTNTFLGEHPWQLLKQGKVKDAPWLVSVATEEGLCPAAMFITDDILVKYLDENWLQIAPLLLDYNYTIPLEHVYHTSQKIRSFYLGDQKLPNCKTRLIKMISDRLFIWHIEQSAKMQAVVTKNPVYFYVFAYKGRCRFSHFLCNCTDNYGVSHGDDMLYLLKTNFIKSTLDLSEEMSMIDRMVNIWSNFSRTGHPSHEGDSNWIPVSQVDDNERNITFTLISSGTNIQSKSVESLGNRRFWETVFFDELENALQPTETKKKDEL